MNKKELISQIRTNESMTWGQATRIVDNIFNMIGDEVAKGNEVYISKFGRFYKAKVAPKPCVHPVTKKIIVVPAQTVVKLRMAAGLKRKMKGR